MSRIAPFNSILALLACTICLPALAAAPDQTAPTLNSFTARIKLDDLSMIIVPVSINGSGPYDFMLDTGSSRTMLDRKLAEELALPRLGQGTVSGVLSSETVSVVRADSLSVAGASVAGLHLFSSDRPLTVMSKVRGVLGEDFLQHFDVLIDYRHQSIRLEPPLSSMAGTALGEHLPLQLNGTCHGQPTPQRLILSGKIAELGGQSMSLLLDSGANDFILFRDSLGAGAIEEASVRSGNFSKWNSSSAETRKVRSLILGRNSVPDLTVIALSRRADVDADGLLPTSLFHSVFISHRGRFIILNPSFPKTSRDGPAAPTAR